MKKLVSLMAFTLAISSSSFARVAETVEDYLNDFVMLSDVKSNQNLEIEAGKTASDDVLDLLKEFELDDPFEELNVSDDTNEELKDSDLLEGFVDIKHTMDQQHAPLQPKLIYEDGVVKQQAGFTYGRLPDIADVANFAYSWTGTNESNYEFDSYAKQRNVEEFKVVKALFEEKNGLNAISLLKDDILYVAYRGTVISTKDLRADIAIGLNNFTSHIQQVIKKGAEYTPAFLNTFVGSLVDGALSKNVETATKFLKDAIEKAKAEGLNYRKVIVTGHSLGGFYAQTIAANNADLVDEAHSFNGPGVPAIYVPYDAPGHHIFNHIRADWTDIDPVGKFAVHQGNVIFYPAAKREGIMQKLNPGFQHGMGGFGDAIRSNRLKPYPGAKLLTFTPKSENQADINKSVLNFAQNQKPVFQREIDENPLYLTSLNSNVFDAFEECSTYLKGITGHENYYFDMVSSGGIKAAQRYKDQLLNIREIMDHQYNILMENPTDDNVEKFRVICKELAENVAVELHQINEQNKQKALKSKSIWSKAKGLFGY
jgi:pimeloyl-ACP methyl ester carboxylesterase